MVRILSGFAVSNQIAPAPVLVAGFICAWTTPLIAHNHGIKPRYVEVR